MDKVDKYRTYNFYINDANPQASCRNINWTSPVGPYTIRSTDNLKLRLWITSGEIGQVWIAFPTASNNSKTIYVDSTLDLKSNISNPRIKTIILKPNMYYGPVDIDNIVDKKLISEYPHLAEISGQGIYVIGLEKSSDIHIENLTINGSGGGIYLKDSSICTISGNNIIAGTHNNIDLDNCMGNTIKTNTMTKTSLENCTIRLQHNSYLNTIMNNYFTLKDPIQIYLIDLEGSCPNYVFNITSGNVLENGIKYIINNNIFNPHYVGCNIWR